MTRALFGAVVLLWCGASWAQEPPPSAPPLLDSQAAPPSDVAPIEPEVHEPPPVYREQVRVEVPPPPPSEKPPLRRSRFFLAGEMLTYANPRIAHLPVGYGLATGSWIHLGALGLHPRVAGHVGYGSLDARLIDLSADMAAAWAPRFGPIAPIVGGGVGFRFIDARGPTQSRTEGSVIQVTTSSQPQASGIGLDAFARVGVLFFPDAPVSFSVNADLLGTFSGPLGNTLGGVFTLGLEI